MMTIHVPAASLRRSLTQMAVAAAAMIGLGTTAAGAAAIDPAFSGSYTMTSFGSPGGIPGPLGGITFLDNNTLLIGGNANNGNGAIYSIGVTRDAGTQQITGFSGPATLFASAPNIDGGLAFGPGGVLFYTTYSNNLIGQILPGGNAPARTDVLPAAYSSVGTLQFVPAGYSGAGNLVVGSYSQGNWGVATLAADGLGTYNISLSAPTQTLPGGPEGIVYVPGGSPLFGPDTALVSLWGAGEVRACGIDANGLPISATCVPFVTGLSGAEGAIIDPLTGSFLFSTFGGGDQVVMVSGFAAPPQPPSEVPEPTTAMLLGAGLLGLAALRRRRSEAV